MKSPSRTKTSKIYTTRLTRMKTTIPTPNWPTIFKLQTVNLIIEQPFSF